MAVRRQKLTLDTRITETLIGPSEISQGDGEHWETSRFLPVNSLIMSRNKIEPKASGARVKRG